MLFVKVVLHGHPHIRVSIALSNELREINLLLNLSFLLHLDILVDHGLL